MSIALAGQGSEHAARRDAIRRLLRGRTVATQEDLRRLLAREGFAVTQATLSRDLARIGARRVALPGGGTAYELEELRVVPEDDALAELRPLVVSVQENGVMVVIHTRAGGAQAVAAALDRARLREVLGTIAGDDTIFLAPARGAGASALAKKLRQRWGIAGR